MSGDFLDEPIPTATPCAFTSKDCTSALSGYICGNLPTCLPIAAAHALQPRRILSTGACLLAARWASESVSPQYNLGRRVTAFLRIVFRLGLPDRERRKFWGFLVHAVTAHPRQFAEAMKLAARGYHFRKLTEAL
ncbi:MAG: DUF4070 domain-containing protein [Acidobacteria bacterium]|nr:DUF4070 domain-containing protein [Acidobacteriota bacterium]